MTMHTALRRTLQGGTALAAGGLKAFALPSEPRAHLQVYGVQRAAVRTSRR